jgi:hypothetical protein
MSDFGSAGFKPAFHGVCRQYDVILRVAASSLDRTFRVAFVI